MSPVHAVVGHLVRDNLANRVPVTQQSIEAMVEMLFPYRIFLRISLGTFYALIMEIQRTS